MLTHVSALEKNWETRTDFEPVSVESAGEWSAEIHASALETDSATQTDFGLVSEESAGGWSAEILLERSG